MKIVFYLITLITASLMLPQIATSQVYDMYVGTYTDGTKSQGIYRYTFNAGTGQAQVVSVTDSPNPSFLARFENRLLAVNEGGGQDATISLFEITPKGLTLVDKSTTLGDHPCHVALDPAGNIALVSNYSGGSLGLFSLVDNRKHLVLHDLMEFDGSGPNTDRQQQSHIHSAFFNNGLAYVSDLGSDQIHVYKPSHDGTGLRNGVLQLEEKTVVYTLEGGGARHVAFSGDGSTLYSLQEITGQVAVFKFEGEEWALKQIVPIFGDGFEGEHGAAELKVSPDGRTLYATNRGDANLIVQYDILANGTLEWRNQYGVQGDGPRNFNITPDGRYVLVANQKTNQIVVFQRDTISGDLSDTGTRIDVPAPVCIIF
ncbi:lactonase family protein [Sphingobacterium corticis]|uniref:Lactonase family protein n=1 Tax=Sphingobacterium corticis TaxID=1812823 RepID=A0ABW5NHU9_9SPHI